jgi:hypothetical protein
MDVAQLSFPTKEDIYLIVRPEATTRSREHKIPIVHIHITTKRMDVLKIESRVGSSVYNCYQLNTNCQCVQGPDSSSSACLFTTFAPFRQKPTTCAIITREKQLHIHDMMVDNLVTPIRKDIKNYRVLKLMMDWDDNRMFALGRPSGSNRMHVLQINVPGSQDDEITITELAQIPGLSEGDQFTEKLSDGGGEKYLLITALAGPNQCCIYRVGLA